MNSNEIMHYVIKSGNHQDHRWIISLKDLAEGIIKSSSIFLGYSSGSCAEVRSQLFRAYDSGYLTTDQHEQLQEQTKIVDNKIQNLIAYLNKTKIRGYRYYVGDPHQLYQNPTSEKMDNLTFPWEKSTNDHL